MAAPAPNKFDPDFTPQVLDSFGPATNPRAKVVLSSLIKHIHDFAREVELTTEEWMMGVQFLNSIGQISTPKRNEGHRICDVIGLESLVDEIANKVIIDSGEVPTSTTILGPFWSPNAPWRQIGGSIIQDPHNGQVTKMHGRVVDVITQKPLKNAVVDIWQASSNGKYDFQDPEGQSDNNLRGKFRTDANGEYWFYCLKPTPYSLPTDGPAGVLLDVMDRSPWRPAHIHLMITHEDYRTVVNQIYPRNDPYLGIDSVFAVKNDLVVDFVPLQGDKHAELSMEYNIRLAPKLLRSNPMIDPAKHKI
ncbi:aromatic compound dioxygenase [Pseudovirgaria hyperparasitica]|uniref:Aromatic compound dioxygenase n=1 Tax=Pseudovirgaria hyperparasitica TaxID=470096 RepID=A0A6A6W0I6_9PEZI|nr:aromatic compound dioxygenase [Pseudovirgaria hyperparasitica]KAF2756422.1 aromatic compound dioxygenase [Pseudovirgaria hyperparasitica]